MARSTDEIYNNVELALQRIDEAKAVSRIAGAAASSQVKSKIDEACAALQNVSDANAQTVLSQLRIIGRCSKADSDTICRKLDIQATALSGILSRIEQKVDDVQEDVNYYGERLLDDSVIGKIFAVLSVVIGLVVAIFAGKAARALQEPLLDSNGATVIKNGKEVLVNTYPHWIQWMGIGVALGALVGVIVWILYKLVRKLMG